MHCACTCETDRKMRSLHCTCRRGHEHTACGQHTSLQPRVNLRGHRKSRATTTQATAECPSRSCVRPDVRTPARVTAYPALNAYARSATYLHRGAPPLDSTATNRDPVSLDTDRLRADHGFRACGAHRGTGRGPAGLNRRITPHTAHSMALNVARHCPCELHALLAEQARSLAVIRFVNESQARQVSKKSKSMCTYVLSPTGRCTCHLLLALRVRGVSKCLWAWAFRRVRQLGCGHGMGAVSHLVWPCVATRPSFACSPAGACCQQSRC